MLKQVRKYQQVSINKSGETNLSETVGNSSEWRKNDGTSPFVSELCNEILGTLFLTNWESKAHFILSLFWVLIARRYLRDHLDQGFPRELSVELGMFHICLIQYGSH